jgi:ADP-dependent NAD(P)H-hydrate dehydratase
MPPPSMVDPVIVTPTMLRGWRLPEPEGGKEQRGRTLIVGGSRETPGAVLLAAEAALRSGAGKLQVATGQSVAALAAMALPEGLVRGLAETSSGAISATAADAVAELADGASSVLIGPGLIDVEECAEFVRLLAPSLNGAVVLDALGLAGVTADRSVLHHVQGNAVLTPNPGELAETLQVDGSAVEEDPVGSAVELARAARAVVALGGTTSWVARPDGSCWRDETGGSGLGVSGSGDVFAGIVAGLMARGAAADQAAVWATHLHGRAGERLAASVGRLGFLARELPPEVPRVLMEVDQ